MVDMLEELTFHTESTLVGANEVGLSGLSGTQAASALYEYRLELHSDLEGGLAPAVIDDLLCQPCHLVMRTSAEDAPDVEVHGVLSEIELHPMSELNRSLYTAVLVPRLWRKTLPYRSRVFQDLDVTAIVSLVLEEDEIPFEMRASGDYPVRDYVVQYEETDFAFLSRQLERWGLFYFFEQSPDGEVMVIADANADFRAIDEHEQLVYVPEDGQLAHDAPRVVALGRRTRPRPASVVVEDYNWRTPTAAVLGEASGDTQSGFGARRHYGDHVKDAGEAAQRAQLRAQEEMVGREIYRGRTSLRPLAPGHRFALTGYPVGDLDQDYAVIAVGHRAYVNTDEAHPRYEHTFTAIPYATPYRAPRRTPWPRIVGFMHGRVDGAVPGMAAPIDEQGRYKLLMPYDEARSPGGQATRWVRMSQTSSGPEYGFHFPLHIGIEVAIAHLDGDPDRPVIIGATPNPDTSTPVTSADATKSRIKTKSGILIEFEDAG